MHMLSNISRPGAGESLRLRAGPRATRLAMPHSLAASPSLVAAASCSVTVNSTRPTLHSLACFVLLVARVRTVTRMRKPDVEVVNPEDEAACAHIRALVEEYVRTWYPAAGDFSPADAELLAGLPYPYVAPSGGAFLAVVDGVPVGCLLALRLASDAAVVELRKMYTRPAFRRVGAGQALLAAAETHARDAGARRLTLSVHEDRIPARRMYEAAGFEYATRDSECFWHMSRTVNGPHR